VTIDDSLVVEVRRPEVQVIVDAAEEAKRQGRRLPWSERAALIRKQFHMATVQEWVSLFDRDPDILAELMRDLLKIDQQVPGKSGPRPGPDFQPGVDLIRKIKGDDYCTLPFHEAFAILAYGMSRTQVARKTKISRSQAHRLLTAESHPSMEEMRIIAKAFKKEPSFFAEWRASFIAGTLANQLDQAPELAINLYRRLVNANRS
jgi:helix-turn-helix protein